MVFFCRGKPHSVVRRVVTLVTQYEDNLVPNVDRKAAEHGAGLGRKRSDRIEHELMRYDLALPDGKQGVIQRGKGLTATKPRHRTYDSQFSGQAAVRPEPATTRSKRKRIVNKETEGKLPLGS